MAERLFTDSDGWRWTVKDVVAGAYVEMTAVPDEITAADGAAPVTTVIPRRDVGRLLSALNRVNDQATIPARPSCDGTCGDQCDGQADDISTAHVGQVS